MSTELTRFYDPVDVTLEKLYKANVLKEPRDLLPLICNTVFFLAPNGNYLWYDSEHLDVIKKFATKNIRLPNESLRPIGNIQVEGFYKDLKIIKIYYESKPNNRLDFLFLTPVTKTQMKTIYNTQKDIPDLWITYDIIDNEKPFSYSGEGYRNMLRDLIKAKYEPSEGFGK